MNRIVQTGQNPAWFHKVWHLHAFIIIYSFIVTPEKIEVLYHVVRLYVTLVGFDFSSFLGFANVSARPYGLRGRLERCSIIVLRHAQIPAQGQCFGISQTTNPKP